MLCLLLTTDAALLQARERMRMVASSKRSRALEEKRRQAGVLLTKEEAAVRIQSALRGHLWRNRVKAEAHQEMVFMNMRPQVTVYGY